MPPVSSTNDSLIEMHPIKFCYSIVNSAINLVAVFMEWGLYLSEGMEKWVMAVVWLGNGVESRGAGDFGAVFVDVVVASHGARDTAFCVSIQKEQGEFTLLGYNIIILLYLILCCTIVMKFFVVGFCKCW